MRGKSFIRILMLITVLMITGCTWHPRVELNRTQGTGTFYVSGGGAGKDRTCMQASSAFFIPNGTSPGYVTMPPGGTGYLRDTNLRSSIPAGPLGPTEFIVRLINFKMYQTTMILLNRIATNPGFDRIVKVCIALMIIFFSIGVVAGITPLNGFAITALATKAIIIAALALNTSFFSEMVIQFTENIVYRLCTIMSNVFSAMPNAGDFTIFTPIDGTISMIFSTKFLKVLIGFILLGLKGLFFIIILIFVMLIYMYSAIKAVSVFLTALVARYFLYFLAPFFLLFFLFKETRGLFDNWMKMLISFSLQPVFAFAYLGMMQLVFMSFLQSVMGNGHICYMKLFGISAIDFYVYFWRFTNDLGVNAAGGQSPNVSFNFLTMFTLIFLTLMMIMFSSWVVEVAGQLAGGAINFTMTPMFGAETMKDTFIRTPMNTVGGGIRGAFMGDGVSRGGLLQGQNPFKGAAAGASSAYKSTRQSIKRREDKTDLDVLGKGTG
ncbi:MAG: hypothetical protein EB060_09000 [Proteobacteria bacterium]|nr:hypothetical protein [Pseudomonadota bacterium]